MKWYNKDKTQMINLDKVDAWFYFPNEGDETRNLVFFVNGAQMESTGEEAEELHNILKNEKDVLHS